MTGQGSVPASVRVGLRENWRQFALLVLVNAFVGGMVGLERTVVPLIGSEEFKIASTTLVVSFIVSFGVVKALANLVSGHFADIYGRKHNAHPWLARRPANALHDRLGPELGQDRRRQCAAWDQPRLRPVDDGHHESVDLVGPKSRGLAVGLNEFAGYISVGLTAFLNGYIAQHHGLRRQPFYIGKACAVLGLVCSPLLVQDTRRHVRLEMADHAAAAEKAGFGEVFRSTAFGDSNLFAASQAGLVNNLNDGMSWGVFPLFCTAFGLGVERIACSRPSTQPSGARCKPSPAP